MTSAKINLTDQAAQLAEQDASPRRRYTAEELVHQCDPEAPLSDEDHAWLNAPPVGREAM